MKRFFGEILAEKREDAGYTQRQVAAVFAQRGMAINSQAVSKWEKNLTSPNMAQLLLLCELYDIRDVLSVFLNIPADNIYSGLNREGQKRVEEYARVLELSGMFAAPENSENSGESSKVIELRRLPVYRLPVSAGTGQFLDGDDYTLQPVGADVPLSADFGVKIAGDSMEPKFTDGQIIWVRRQETLNSGEIGVFFLDGDSYCKKFSCDNGVSLVSLNKKYPSIKVDEYSQFRIFGKVVK